jgi:hypothetical protein
MSMSRGHRGYVSIKDISASDWETVSLANNPHFIAIIEASRRSYREKGGIALDQIRQELGLKPKKAASTKPRRG